MEKTNFADYIDRLNELFTDGRGVYTDFQEARSAAQKRIKDVAHMIGLSAAKKAAAAEDAAEATQEATAGLSELRATVDATINAIRKELEAEQREYMLSRPEDVDPAAITLMNSGTMAIDDLAALANGATPTMLKLISKEAKSRGTVEGVALAGKIDAFLNPAARLDVFDKAAYMVSASFHDSGAYGAVNANVWTGGECDKARASMAALSTYGGAANEG